MSNTRKSCSRIAATTAVFAAALMLTPAIAADLGGNCCADLEERIAELEATTARKGNRKVSLEIYGQVNEAVMFWDDGSESNAYVLTNDQSRTRIGFRGKAKVTSDIEVGYRLEIGVRIANSKAVNQDDPNAGAGLDLRDSNWFIKSKSMGTVTVGAGTTATNAITELDQTQVQPAAKFSDVEDTGLGLRLRSAANGGLSSLSWRRLIGDGGDQPGEGERAVTNVRYETPALYGFTVSTSWGADDLWDAAIRYSGDVAGFKLSAGIGYGEITDNNQTQSVCMSAPAGQGADGSDTRCHQFGGSISALHEATGLFVNFAAGTKIDDILSQTARFAGTGADDGQHFWAVQAGIEQKFNALGKTTLFGQYYDYSGGANGRRTIDGTDGGVADPLNPFAVGGDSAVWSSGMQVYGGGIVQGLDAASILIYAYYRHYEADLTARQLNGGVANGAIAGVALEDLDVVMTGALIKF